MASPEEIYTVAVPSTLEVPLAMQDAHQRLLAQFAPDNPPQVINLQSMVSSPDSEIIVVVRSGQPETDRDWGEIYSEDYLGTLSLLLLRTLTRDLAHIEHVAVDPNAHGMGIGKKLVAKALEIGSERGVSRFDLTSGANKLAAQALYRTMGFVQRDTNNWRYEP